MALIFPSCHAKPDVQDILNVEYRYPPAKILIDSGRHLDDMSKLIGRLKFIPLHTPSDQPFGTIDKVIVYRNHYFVMDMSYSSLKEFDSAGQFVRTYGSLGEGAGKYTALKDFIVDTVRDNVILLINDPKYSRMYFDLKGRFLRYVSTGLYAFNFGLLGTSWYYYLGNVVNEQSGKYNLIIVDSASDRVSRAFNIRKGYQPIYDFSGFLKVDDDGFIYNGPLSDTVYQVTPDRIATKYIIDFGAPKLPDSLRTNSYRFLKYSLDYSYLRNDLIEFNRYLIFSYPQARSIHRGIYDRKTNILHTIGPSDATLLATLWGTFVGHMGDSSVITYIPAGKAPDYIASGDSSKERIMKYYPQLYKLCASGANSDIPILVTFDIKPLD